MKFHWIKLLVEKQQAIKFNYIETDSPYRNEKACVRFIIFKQFGYAVIKHLKHKFSLFKFVEAVSWEFYIIHQQGFI